MILSLMHDACQIDGLVYSPAKAQRVVEVCISSSMHFCAVTDDVTGVIVAAVDEMPLHNRQSAKIIALVGEGQRELLDALKAWAAPRPAVRVFSPPEEYCEIPRGESWH
jgi:hypothetical protein